MRYYAFNKLRISSLLIWSMNMKISAGAEAQKGFYGCRSVLTLLAALVFLGGCGGGDETYSVKGQVTYEGQPLQQGTVMFNPTGSELPPVVGRIQSDGSYEVKAAPGDYKVVVNATTEVDPNLEPDDPGYQPPTSLIPEVYSNPLQTPLEATITSGENTVPLDL
jgi:hypothetical protein